MERASKLAFKPRMKAAERREAIEIAAAELFAERGYEASSLEDIARAAGVTKRVIYDHFGAKRDLHIALLHRHAAELLSYVATHVALDVEPRLRMAAGVEAFFRFVEEHPYAWRMLFRDPPADPLIAAAHREVQDRATVAIAVFLGQEPGLRQPGGRHAVDWLTMMAEQLKTALNGLASWWYEHRDIPRADIIAAATDFAWTGTSNLVAETEGPSDPR